MPCKIVIPSRKRAGKVLTKISDAILFVEKKEKDKYKEHYPEIEIETHDGLNSLSEIRQKIYERYGDVFMVDDDIQEVIRLYKCEKYK